MIGGPALLSVLLTTVMKALILQIISPSVVQHLLQVEVLLQEAEVLVLEEVEVLLLLQLLLAVIRYLNVVLLNLFTIRKTLVFLLIMNVKTT